MKKNKISVLLTLITVNLAGASISDSLPRYKVSVEKAGSNEIAFKKFRCNPTISLVYENLVQSQGMPYFNKISSSYPELLGFMGEFKKNDLFGGPPLYNYPGVNGISASTVRYVYFLGEILSLFNLQKGCKIVEIGGGYGGQCSVISRLVPFGDYLLIDLDYALPLVEKYLSGLGIQNFRTKPTYDCSLEEEYDLFISNYAISEVDVDSQDEYIREVISLCKRGFIVYNFIKGKSLEVFCDKLKAVGINPSVVEKYDGDSQLIYWGADK